MELGVSEEKLIEDNPRDRLIARLQSLRNDRKAENQKIKALEKQVKKDRKKMKELMRLDEYKQSYIAVFEKMAGKYLGFQPYEILGPHRDEKSIASLEEIISARAKRNMIIGVAIALSIPLIGWAALMWALLESVYYRGGGESGDVELTSPLKFFRLKRRLKKNGVNASSFLAEHFN